MLLDIAGGHFCEDIIYDQQKMDRSGHNISCMFQRGNSYVSYVFLDLENISMISLSEKGCKTVETASVPSFCLYESVLNMVDPCGRQVFCPPKCTCNQEICADGFELQHIKVKTCLSLPEALAEVYKQTDVTDTDQQVEIMEQLAYLTSVHWRRGYDLLIIYQKSFHNRCALQWTISSVNKTPEFVPCAGNFLLSDTNLGPGAIVFEELSDQEIIDMDKEYEYVSYCKFLASACQIKSDTRSESNSLFIYGLDDRD
tara:strand:+ start:4326 stop:5093 length:768 start_codon:yes stop_codon:yes gene_type:complete